MEIQINRLLDLDVDLLKDVNRTVQLYVYAAIGFLVPFFLGHPQLLVGAVVNTMLITSALESRGHRVLLPLAVMPSLGVLSRGLLFGPFTPFLIYMLPAVWVGNLVLMVLVRSLKARAGKNYWVSLGLGAGAKTLFLYSSALVMVSLGFVPAMFLDAMGLTQLWTALAGGAIAFALLKTSALRRLSGL